MKKNISKIVISLLLLVIIGMVVFIVIKYFNNKQIKTDNMKTIWTIYDNDLDNIRTNLNEITEKNADWEWFKLKSIRINDDDLKNTYDLLVADIRMCYIYATDNGERYTNSNPIVKYRDTKIISDEELKSLQSDTKSDSCLNAFQKYATLKLATDLDEQNRILEKINMINTNYKTDLYTGEAPTYDEMLGREVLKINMISNLSDWLKEEYNRNK